MTDLSIPTGPKNPSSRPIDHGSTRVLPLSTPTGPSNTQIAAINASPLQQVRSSSPRIPEPRPSIIEPEPVQLWLKHTQEFQYKNFLHHISSSTSSLVSQKFKVVDFRFKGFFSFLTLIKYEEARRFIDLFQGNNMFE